MSERNNGSKKRKSKKSRKLTPFMKLICFVVIAFSASLLITVARNVIDTIALKNQLADAEKRLEEVKVENDRLTEEKNKLSDPDYVANHARDSYLITEDEGKVIYLPENDKR